MSQYNWTLRPRKNPTLTYLRTKLAFSALYLGIVPRSQWTVTLSPPHLWPNQNKRNYSLTEVSLQIHILPSLLKLRQGYCKPLEHRGQVCIPQHLVLCLQRVEFDKCLLTLKLPFCVPADSYANPHPPRTTVTHLPCLKPLGQWQWFPVLQVV